jgi:hypothetical protein
VNVLLSGVVGSTAYGLATTDSDVDRLGVFAAPTEAFHGLNFPAESHVTTAPDRTLHEARKYARLALSGNPTVMELMWLSGYEVRTELGDDLVSIRSAFLVAKRVRDAYLGYATQQFRRLENRGGGSFSSDLRNRTAKHARHLARLCWQGYHLYRAGELLIRLPEQTAQGMRHFGDCVAGGDINLARSHIAFYEHLFSEHGTPLPDRPDEAAVERWLLAVRTAHLAVPSGVR